MEVKRLHGKIAAMRSELSKHEEELADCKRYRSFLDDITPAAHFQAQARATEGRREAALAAWRAECDAVREAKAAAHAAKAAADAAYANARTQQARRPPQPAAPVSAASTLNHTSLAHGSQSGAPGRGDLSVHVARYCYFLPLQEADRAMEDIKAAADHLREVLPRPEPPEPAPEAAAAAGDGAMHFTQPAQLLQILQTLEEQNLFLVQTGQEVEEELEAIKGARKCASRFPICLLGPLGPARRRRHGRRPPGRHAAANRLP